MPAATEWARFEHVHGRMWGWYYANVLLVALGPVIVAILPARRWADVVHVLIALGLVASSAALPYYGYRMRRCLGSRWALGWAVLMAMPVLNTLVIAAIEQDVVKARAARDDDARTTRPENTRGSGSS